MNLTDIIGIILIFIIGIVFGIATLIKTFKK
jgi:hypothetical protein